MNDRKITPQRRRRIRITDLALAASILAGLSLLVTIGSQPSPAASEERAAGQLAALATPAQDSDIVAIGFPVDLHGDGGLQTESFRYLGADNHTKFWTALDQAFNICLVAQSIDDPELTVASCESIDLFETEGVSLRLDNSDWQFEAFLVPDAVDTADISAPWQAVGSNLILVDGAGPESIVLPRHLGGGQSDITLVRLEDPTTS